LSEQDRAMLIYAHQNDIAQYVILADNTFIGTHCANVPHLNVIEHYNDWYIGTMMVVSQPLINNQQLVSI